MPGPLDSLPEEQRGLPAAARTGTELAERPMPATLSDRRDFPDTGEWLFERKLDGVRLPAVREAGRVTLLPRD
ncbi:hypothetical protein [Streptomyces sp. NPDC058954]|uniref:hypothetical protein n=1 Tax=Streptomyces sp. NPDC058954 TaxID=3346677 RepID=UPI0036CE15FE